MPRLPMLYTNIGTYYFLLLKVWRLVYKEICLVNQYVIPFNVSDLTKASAKVLLFYDICKSFAIFLLFVDVYSAVVDE